MNKYAKPYKTRVVGGVPTKTPVSRSEVKSTIMKVRGWDEKTYRKQVDMFKNRLRAYEAIQKEGGAKVTPQSPVSILYAQAKAMKRLGSEYKPSAQMRAIESTPAYSITKGRSVAKKPGSAAYKAAHERIRSQVDDDFANFIDAHPDVCAEIAERYGDNAVMYKEAMAAYAEAVKAARPKGGKVGVGGIQEYGESAGSPDSVEFDFEAFEASFSSK